MAISIQTLNFMNSKGQIYQPVLRKSTGLQSLLLQYETCPPFRGLEKRRDNPSTAKQVPCFRDRRLMKWRAFQFRDPDDTYVFRARIEPHPPELPIAEPKQHSAAVSLLCLMMVVVLCHETFTNNVHTPAPFPSSRVHSGLVFASIVPRHLPFL